MSPPSSRGRHVLVFLIAGGVLCVAIVLSLAIGARNLSPAEVLHALLNWDDSAAASVVIDQRLPRTVIGLLVGAGLAAAGVVMQALTRNPLADPRIFGVASGASLGVVIAITVFGATALTQYVWFGVTGALLAGMVGFGVAHAAARGRASDSPVTLALVGAGLDASLSAIIYAVLTTNVQSFDQYRFWVVGSLAGRDAAVAVQVAPFLLAGLLLTAVIARGLDALVLGEDVAVGLGQRAGLVRLGGSAAVALMTGAAVAAAGPVGFIGLAVPHLARPLVGGGHRGLLGLSLLLGPTMLLLSDVVGRRMTSGELPAGIVTALIGAPLLILLVRRARTVTA